MPGCHPAGCRVRDTVKPRDVGPYIEDRRPVEEVGTLDRDPSILDRKNPDDRYAEVIRAVEVSGREYAVCFGTIYERPLAEFFAGSPVEPVDEDDVREPLECDESFLKLRVDLYRPLCVAKTLWIGVAAGSKKGVWATPIALQVNSLFLLMV